MLPAALSEKYPFLVFRPEGIFVETAKLALYPPHELYTVLSDLFSDCLETGWLIRKLGQSLFLLNHAVGLEAVHLERLPKLQFLGLALECLSVENGKLGPVRFSEDRYTAYIRINPWAESGHVLDSDRLIAHLWQNGIHYGYRASLLKAALSYGNGKVNATRLAAYYRDNDLPGTDEGYLPIALGRRLACASCSEDLKWHIVPHEECGGQSSDPGHGGFSVKKGDVIAEYHCGRAFSNGIRIDGSIERPTDTDAEVLSRMAGAGVTVFQSREGGQKMVATREGLVCRRDGNVEVLSETPASETVQRENDEEELLCGPIFIVDEGSDEDGKNGRVGQLKESLEELKATDGRIVENLHRMTEKIKQVALTLDDKDKNIGVAKLKKIGEHYRQFVIRRNRELSRKAQLTAQIRVAKDELERELHLEQLRARAKPPQAAVGNA